MYKLKFVLYFLSLLSLCFSCKENSKTEKSASQTNLNSPTKQQSDSESPSLTMQDHYEKAKKAFIDNPNDIDNIIWYGRRTAYLAKYSDAIKIYSDGIKQYPGDARLYRHRGHRHISMRNYDLAIADLKYAATLIEDTANEIEPDGLPNKLNIPLSSLHGNIWYHLGLAYYLVDDMHLAYEAFLNCRDLQSNDDNTVSSTHWLYMIQRRMGNPLLAYQVLQPINNKMTIIENTSYYNLCRFYKEILPLDSLQTGASSPQNDAVRYGIANWFYYNQDIEQAKSQLETILQGTSTSSFGYIAAEADYARFFQEK